MSKYKLSTNKLVSGYDDKVVVNNVSVEIPQEKISVIIGANGSGKSTLLKTMTRIIKPMSGQALLNGESVHTMNPKELALICGMLPQNPIVPDGVTVSDLVMRGRYPHQKFLQKESKEDLRAIYEAMEMVGVLEFADNSVNELSGGQRQRVWVATAIAQETEILFLDEPTTFLDMNYQVEILDIMAKLNKEKNKTIVMVLHDINMASRYCHHMFAMKDGKIIASGEPKDIITKELIKEIFNMDANIINDPNTNSPYVIPIGKYNLDN